MDRRTSGDRLSAMKKAIVEIRALRGRLAEAESRSNEPIAIVGCALRFPGAADVESYWSLLAGGVDAIREIPRDRWDIDAFFDPDPDAPGKMYTRSGGFLREIDRFDARFFGISPREAASMDPQHRLLLEVAWEALEDAGISAESLNGTPTGVYIGISNSDYGRMVLSDPARIDTYASIGTSYSVIAGRLSYLLGLQGPSIAVDTACSSSLVAVHLAVQSLRSGESRVAIAGGSNLMISPEVNVNFCKARMLAPDGKCKTFDAGADGYVRGEGCGVVVLKRLSDALVEGDRIRAVVRGTAVNQDGRSSGLTAPNGPSQEAVIRAALANAGLEAGDVDYVEAHGTGTSLGDPIEVGALGAALCAGRPTDRPLRIGSVKTNIGHLEASAGVAGLIKVILALERETIPAQLHFHVPNPHIDWARWPVEVVMEAEPWPRGDHRRVAGVSSFGFSGTNAHLVVEEPPIPSPENVIDRPWHLLTVSAKTPTALAKVAARLSSRLREARDLELADVAFASNAGKTHFAERATVLAESIEGASESLRRLAEGTGGPEVLRGRVSLGGPPEIAFLFPGQGSQYHGMARQLFEAYPVFREVIERCDAVLRGELPLPLLDILYGEDPGPMEEIRNAQPALFAVECAMATLWRSWGVEPAAVLGHSAGELAAGVVAGAMTLEDGARLIAHRSRFLQELPRVGSMAAIFSDRACVEAAIARSSGALTVGAYNGPSHVVVSGETAALADLLNAFTAEGVKNKLLRIDNAYHSPLLDPMLDEFERVASSIPYRDPKVEWISNVTGAAMRAGDLDANYWRRQVRNPVLFHQGVQALGRSGFRIFLEAGPGSTLLGIAQEDLGEEGLAWLASVRRMLNDWQQVLETAANLYVRGVPIRWREIDRPFARMKVRLPSYPFERERYWFDVAKPAVTPRNKSRWDASVAAGAEQAGQAPLDLALETFRGKWDCLAKLASAYELSALKELGAFSRVGERHTAEGLCERLGVLPGYVPLLRCWMESLATEGRLRAEGGVYIADAPIDVPSIAPIQAEASERMGDYRALYDYAVGCGPVLPGVLTGRVSALETLFPGGSYTLTEGLYRTSPVARYLNAIVRSVVAAAVRSGDVAGSVRLLEIGAGTGGTTTAILSALPPDRAQYVFTDVSDLFLTRAKEMFSPYPFVRYGKLDIERDPTAQGYPLGGFDIVIAANVLHATRDLSATLRNVRSLLAPGGLLVLSETTSHHRVFEITTGLIEGWQRFEDGVRDEHPLLPAERWVEILLAEGFSEAAFWPGAGGPGDVLGNRIIAAATPEAAGRPVEVSIAAVETEGADAGRPLAGGGEAAAGGRRLEEIRFAHPEERKILLAEFVRGLIMEILRLGEKHAPALRDRLMDLGFDSLMAVQLRNRIVSGLGIEEKLPATLVFDYPTCEDIGNYLAGLLGGGDAASGKGVPPTG
ncbi:MAG: hypothetical protein H6Q82_844, partial [Deltaproteobacteria bacterium]|nr:hypothetical protein [Deltaproteobacteria bacterium]